MSFRPLSHAYGYLLPLCLLPAMQGHAIGVDGSQSSQTVALKNQNVNSEAMVLLKKNRDAMIALRGYRAQCQMAIKNLKAEPGSSPLSYQFSVLTASKPGLMRYDMWEGRGSTPLVAKPATASQFAMVSNGSTHWIQSPQGYQSEKSSDPQTLVTSMEPWDGFYYVYNTYYEQVQNHISKKADVVVRALGREKVDGVSCDRVEIDTKEKVGERLKESRKLIFLRPDGLVRRQIETFINGESTVIVTSNLLRIEKNPDLRGQSFEYTPPKGGARFTAPTESPQSTSHATLLSNGTLAPELVAKDKSGKVVRLSELKGKVVVLDFWASWCFPCVSSMPHTQSVADKLHKEGVPVVVVAVDDAEKIDGFKVWVTEMAGKYPAITFAYSPQEAKVSSKLFKVSNIPTQYIVDATGTIRASFIGYGGETNDLEKAIRAAIP